MNAWIVVLIVAVCSIVLVGTLLLWMFSVKSSLAKKQEKVTDSLERMENQMKKRYDLVAKLIQVGQKSANKKNDLFEKVVQARYSCLSSQTIPEKEKNEVFLVRSLKELFLCAANDKDLKKNEEFAEISTQLEEIDVDILDAKRTYNANVQAFNHMLELPFSKGLAKKLKYSKAEIFNIDLVK